MSVRAGPFLAFVALLGAMTACEYAADQRLPDAQTVLDGTGVVEGQIEFLDLEGGCWVIRVSEQVRYSPIGLPQEFRREGLKVRAELRRRDDMAGVCMVGPIVEILSIQRL